MIQLPILDESYWTLLEILAEETGNIREFMTEKCPWYPSDGDRFEWAFLVKREKSLSKIIEREAAHK
jgi:hypothetical protein